MSHRFTGPLHALLDRGKLESALGRPLATFSGAAVFPTTAGRAAALLESIAQAHSFMDANKRTAWLAMNTYLGLGGLQLALSSPAEAGGFVLDVVEHRIDTLGAALWIDDRIVDADPGLDA